MNEDSLQAIEAENAKLAAFQEALLDLLASPLSPSEMMRRLATDEVFAFYRSYTTTFELRMVEVAATLTKKWGRREAGILAREDSSVDTG